MSLATPSHHALRQVRYLFRVTLPEGPERPQRPCSASTKKSRTLFHTSFLYAQPSSLPAADQVVPPPRREEMRGGHCVQSSATINPGIASPPNLAAW